MQEWIDKLLPEKWRSGIPIVTGTIGFSTPLKPGLTIAATARNLERAFGIKKAKAVALIINSPGGSPVQSSLIYKRIRALAQEKELPVYAFAEDVAASGGYMLACAADEIYADESSIIGSIGVVSAGFGFAGLIEKLGIERRVHTAGESKAMLDPFRPEKAEDVMRLEALQRDVHDNFKALVRRSRGGRLIEPADGLFTGEFWAGQAALDRGLIDGLGDLRTIMRQKFGDHVRLRLVGGRKPFWQRRIGFAARVETQGAAGLGEGFARGLVAAVEARSLWSRFGL